MAVVPTQRPAGVGAYSRAPQPVTSVDDYVPTLEDNPPPPPPRRPRLTRQQWWYVNKQWITVLSLIVAVIVALWVINNVPVVSVTHSYAERVVTADHWINVPVNTNLALAVGPAQAPSACESNSVGIDFPPNDTGFIFVDSPTMGTGATLSATYADPNGTPIVVWAFLGNSSCFATNTSGSFVLSTPGQAWPAQITIMTPVPVTVYVNLSYSYLAPFAALL